MPRDFNTDGAAGGYGGDGGSPTTAGSPVGGTISGDWTTGNPGGGSPGAGSDASMSPLNPTGANFNPGAVALAGGGYRLPVDGGSVGTSSSPGNDYFGGVGIPIASMFADGGSVDDDQGGDPNGQLGDLMSLALSSVDQGVDYLRKKHGIGGQQQASMQGRTPMVPGSQSESGIPPIRPMPGPLPPTSNPFGQRKQFGQNDQDQGDQGGGQETAQAGAIPDGDSDDEEGAA